MSVFFILGRYELLTFKNNTKPQIGIQDEYIDDLSFNEILSTLGAARG
jgi:hypothetical protein